MTDKSVTAQILDILIPFFGEDMSRGSLLLTCKKYNLNIENIARENLPAISQDIESWMKIFLGTAKAKAVAASILAISP
jgi:hypothetical protein